MNAFIELLGWVGVAALLIAYAGVSFKKLSPTSTAYQILNAVGGVLSLRTLLITELFLPHF